MTAADRPDPVHACTVTTRPDGDTGRLTVHAVCSCLQWEAEGITNPWAPAYDEGQLPTFLRALHRDHLADLILDGHPAVTGRAA